MQRLIIRFTFSILVIVILLAAYSVSTRAQEAQASWTYSTYQGKVSDVHDGNTITVLAENKKLRVRLLGVDAPTKGQTLADESRDNLARLLKGNNVEVLAIPQADNQDNNKSPLIGKVLMESIDAGLEQIRGGFGWQSNEFENYQTDKDRRVYAETEKSAAEKKLGLWRDAYKCKNDSVPTTTNPSPLIKSGETKARVSGSVQVRVLIDESGNVISAKALCGFPLLQQAAVKAAYGAKFTSTFVSGSPVRVTGVITYKFVAELH